MRSIRRIIAISLIVPLFFFGVLCCQVGMAQASSCCCYSVYSIKDNPQSSCDTSSKTQKGKNCECFKAGIFDHSYPKSFTITENSVPSSFVLAFQEVYQITQRFFNYESPPKIVQNSLPLYLQISILRL